LALPPEAAAALARLELFGINFGLERTARLLAELGDPQVELPAVLVAGTNGKGSVAALVDAVVREAGYRTGLYTSPHLEEVEERLQIGGRAIEGGRLGARVLEAIAAAERVLDGPPTYFEALTAAAFVELAEAGVDLAVLEVGLGGRLDATNLSDPMLSLITPIGLEHRAWLGDTATAIAREKAGILRPGRPAIAWGGDTEADAALAAVAEEVGAELTFGDRAASIERVEALGWEGQRLTVITPRPASTDAGRASHSEGARHELITPLLGAHQATNIAHAILAAETLATLGFDRIDAPAIARGVAAVRWPGRLEPVPLPPGAGPRRVLLDAGHNPHAAAAVAAFLDTLAARGEGPVDLLLGLLADKEAEAIVPPLAARCRRVTLTLPPHARGRDPRDLLPLAPTATVLPDLPHALDHALAAAPDTLLVTGSFYLAGTARRLLRHRFGTPAPTP
jgi:dihydrofolate synthase/folylpolyglutamate synthase